MSKKGRNLIAVYGTLRKGCSNHRVIEKGVYLGNYESKPIFNMYSLGDHYPALKLNGNTSILFEVYEIDDVNLKSVNALEGYAENNDSNGKYPNYYDRKIIQTPYGEAYIYIFEGEISNYNKVESGDWKEYLQMESINQMVGL